MSRYKKRTIYQILVEAGLVKSKKQAVDLARNEEVVIDGMPVTSLHYQVNPRKSRIVVQGREVKLEDKRRYFILNKPKGVITNKENILEFLKDNVKSGELFSYYPVGRLDKDTTGLLIITNDGRLGNKILNPKQKIAKHYEATISGEVSNKSIEQLESGVEILLEENYKITKYKTKPAKVKILSFQDNQTIIGVVIKEGKKRQIARMFESLNYQLIDLKRTKVGKLELGDLEIGRVKEIPKNDLLNAVF